MWLISNVDSKSSQTSLFAVTFNSKLAVNGKFNFRPEEQTFPAFRSREHTMKSVDNLIESTVFRYPKPQVSALNTKMRVGLLNMGSRLGL